MDTIVYILSFMEFLSCTYSGGLIFIIFYICSVRAWKVNKVYCDAWATFCVYFLYSVSLFHPPVDFKQT